MRRLVIVWAATMILAWLSVLALMYLNQAKELGSIMSLPITISLLAGNVMASTWEVPKRNQS